MHESVNTLEFNNITFWEIPVVLYCVVQLKLYDYCGVFFDVEIGKKESILKYIVL